MKPDYVSINGHIIRRNTRHGTDDPPIRVASGRNDSKPRYAREIRINGPCRLLYSPNGCAILKCGARLVIEAEPGAVEIVR